MATTIQPPAQSRDGARKKNVKDRRTATSHLLLWCGLVALSGCRDERGSPPSSRRAASDDATHKEYPDVAAAISAIIPPTTRLVGFGELHARTDRQKARSTLALFGDEILPALAARTSHLAVETWTIAGECGDVAARATEAVEAQVKRPASTKSDLARLGERSRALGLATHAMRVTCRDYEAMAKGDDEAIAHMLDVTTAELGRLGKELTAAAPAERPLVILYGGALHNDRAPTSGLESWSYAAAVEAASAGTYVEIDVIVPELALADPQASAAPWARYLGKSEQVQVVPRGERSFVVILPMATGASAASPSR